MTRDVKVGDRVAIPAGSRAIGSVMQVERGGKFKERARLGIRFHTLVLADGTRVPISTETIYRDGEAPGNSSAAKVGGAAVGGAIIGAILGGAKGAAIGATAGAGGGTAAVMAGDRQRGNASRRHADDRPHPPAGHGYHRQELNRTLGEPFPRNPVWTEPSLTDLVWVQGSPFSFSFPRFWFHRRVFRRMMRERGVCHACMSVYCGRADRGGAGLRSAGDQTGRCLASPISRGSKPPLPAEARRRPKRCPS